jgi:hypothetical protein
MNWHFRTIGMGTINYRKAASRLAREVDSTGLFKSSFGSSEEFLRNRSTEFWKNHEEVLKARVPGFGWWIWKPEFIRICLEDIPKGDGLFYLDSGSSVSRDENALSEIRKMLELAQESSVVAAHGQTFLELNYSSSELMNLLNLSEAQRNSPQHYAGFLLTVNDDKGKGLVKNWCRLACANQHEYLFPSNRSAADLELIHHMYDQAILSSLIKSNGLTSIEIGDKQNKGAVRVIRHRYAYGVDEKSSAVIFFYKLIGFASKVRLAIEHRIFRDSLSKRPSDHVN